MSSSSPSPEQQVEICYDEVAPVPTTTTTRTTTVGNGEHTAGQDRDLESQQETTTTTTSGHQDKKASEDWFNDAAPIERQTNKRGMQQRRNLTEIASSPSPPILSGYKPTKAPKETLLAVYKTAEYKAGLPMNLLIIQSFMAGIYIAMAGHLFLAVGGGLLGAALFPTGLIAVILTSAELFTGDALVFVAGVLGGRVPISKMFRNWTVSWIFNFAGGLAWAALLSYASDSLEDLNQSDFAIEVALKKAHQPWINIFLKGIGANFMVCVAVWQATTAEEVAGKILALWFPITAFVLLGFDHCIANQFLIPVGMMLGADISVVELLFEALLPATLGNLLGGGLCVGGVYWYVFDSLVDNKRFMAAIRDGLTFRRRRPSQVDLRTTPSNHNIVAVASNNDHSNHEDDILQVH